MLLVSGKNIAIGESHRVEYSKLTKYKTIISPFGRVFKNISK